MGSSRANCRSPPAPRCAPAIIGVLVFAALALIGWRHYYASAAVLLAFAALIAMDLVRFTAAADRTLAQFVDGLFAEGYDGLGAGSSPGSWAWRSTARSTASPMSAPIASAGSTTSAR